MIRRIFDEETLNLPSNAVEAQKIRALWRAYSAKYDFCRFFASENAAVCIQDGNAVVYMSDEDNCDFDELAEFFTFCGAREIFCSEKTGICLSKLIECKTQFVNLMHFSGDAVTADVEKNPPLQEVFEVIRQAFGLSDRLFEPWYLDMSHKIRHQVSEIYRLGSSVLVVQYHHNNEVLVSQVATLPFEQGRGGASKLIKAVCAEFADSVVKIICTDDLIPFYTGIGFIKESKKCNLIPDM